VEHAVDLAADVAKVAGWWVSSKDWVGRKLIRLGELLSADMRTAQQDRITKTRDALPRIKEARGV
jgi:hypothetical protein